MKQMFQKMAFERSFRMSLIVLFLSELTTMVGPLIDGILIAAFLGALGVQAFGVVNPLLAAYNAIGSVFAVGSVSLCTRLLGKGKTDEAKGAFTVSFLWDLGLSIGVTIILLSISDPMIHLLGTANASKELFAEARNYYIGITVSFPAINLMIHMTTYMQVDNDRRRALISTMVLTGVDIAGDLLSATVLDGGMLGMGLSTSIANYAALLVLLLHFHKKEALFKNAISVRCLIDQDQTIQISIRDDCKPFSRVEWKDIHEPGEDPTTNIGIRLTSGISQEMRYVNVMNMNSLYITI